MNNNQNNRLQVPRVGPRNSERARLGDLSPGTTFVFAALVEHGSVDVFLVTNKQTYVNLTSGHGSQGLIEGSLCQQPVCIVRVTATAELV